MVALGGHGSQGVVAQTVFVGFQRRKRQRSDGAVPVVAVAFLVEMHSRYETFQHVPAFLGVLERGTASLGVGFHDFRQCFVAALPLGFSRGPFFHVGIVGDVKGDFLSPARRNGEVPGGDARDALVGVGLHFVDIHVFRADKPDAPEEMALPQAVGIVAAVEQQRGLFKIRQLAVIHGAGVRVTGFQAAVVVSEEHERKRIVRGRKSRILHENSPGQHVGFDEEHLRFGLHGVVELDVLAPAPGEEFHRAGLRFHGLVGVDPDVTLIPLALQAGTRPGRIMGLVEQVPGRNGVVGMLLAVIGAGRLDPGVTGEVGKRAARREVFDVERRPGNRDVGLLFQRGTFDARSCVNRRDEKENTENQGNDKHRPHAVHGASKSKQSIVY